MSTRQTQTIGTLAFPAVSRTQAVGTLRFPRLKRTQVIGTLEFSVIGTQEIGTLEFPHIGGPQNIGTLEFPELDFSQEIGTLFFAGIAPSNANSFRFINIGQRIPNEQYGQLIFSFRGRNFSGDFIYTALGYVRSRNPGDSDWGETTVVLCPVVPGGEFQGIYEFPDDDTHEIQVAFDSEFAYYRSETHWVHTGDIPTTGPLIIHNIDLFTSSLVSSSRTRPGLRFLGFRPGGRVLFNRAITSSDGRIYTRWRPQGESNWRERSTLLPNSYVGLMSPPIVFASGFIEHTDVFEVQVSLDENYAGADIITVWGNRLPPNPKPKFSDSDRIATLVAFTANGIRDGVDIDIILPEATGGNPPLRYSYPIFGDSFGLEYDPDTRRLSGKLTDLDRIGRDNTLGEYVVRDVDHDRDTIYLTVDVGTQVIGSLEFPSLNTQTIGTLEFPEFVNRTQVIGTLEFPAIASTQEVGTLEFPHISGEQVIGTLGFPAIIPTQIIGTLEFPSIGTQIIGTLEFPFIGTQIIGTLIFPDLVTNIPDITHPVVPPVDPPGDLPLDPRYAGRWYIEVGYRQPDGTLRPQEQTDKVLSILSNLGRPGGTARDQAQGLSLSMSLNNTDQRFDNLRLPPGGVVNVFYDYRGVRYPVVLAWVKDLDTPIRPYGGRIATLAGYGTLERLNQAQFETSIFIENEVLVHQVVNQMLDNIGWPASQRNIDHSDVRLIPFEFNRGPGRNIVSALDGLRALEIAEHGIAHEDLGRALVFERRYHRYLDRRAPIHDVGDGSAIIPVPSIRWLTIDPHPVIDDVYNRVEVNATAKTVLANVEIWTMDPGQAIITVPANGGINFKADMVTQSSFLVASQVRGAARWQLPVQDAKDASSFVASQPLTVEQVAANQNSVIYRFLNKTATPAVITALSIWGEGIQQLGDLNYVAVDQDSIDDLDFARTYPLPSNFLQERLNAEEDDPTAEARDYADLILLEQSRPVETVDMTFDPLQSDYAIRHWLTARLGDPVFIFPFGDVRGGNYYLEQIGLDADLQTKRVTARWRLSPRGRKSIRADSSDPHPDITSTEWTTLRGFRVPDQPDKFANDLSLVAMEADFITAASTDPEGVLRVVLDGKVIRSFREADLVGKPTLAVLTRLTSGQTVTIQGRRRNNQSAAPVVLRSWLVRMEAPSAV